MFSEKAIKKAQRLAEAEKREALRVEATIRKAAKERRETERLMGGRGHRNSLASWIR